MTQKPLKKKQIKKIKKLTGKGFSAKEISDKLEISLSTVYKYRKELNS